MPQSIFCSVKVSNLEAYATGCNCWLLCFGARIAPIHKNEASAKAMVSLLGSKNARAGVLLSSFFKFFQKLLI